ncbi:hypothetical protein [Streptomyces sp. NPDC101150]|uniref:hypothetical protein n=1 Tax=Streptomyces sp. NPDC101150 TaxID=3366114 RepID=UPI0037FCD7C3
MRRAHRGPDRCRTDHIVNGLLTTRTAIAMRWPPVRRRLLTDEVMRYYRASDPVTPPGTPPDRPSAVAPSPARA